MFLGEKKERWKKDTALESSCSVLVVIAFQRRDEGVEKGEVGKSGGLE